MNMKNQTAVYRAFREVILAHSIFAISTDFINAHTYRVNATI